MIANYACNRRLIGERNLQTEPRSEPRRRAERVRHVTRMREVMQQTGQASRDRVTLRRLCRAAPCTRFQHLCHTPRNGIAGSRCLLYCLPHQPREELRGLSWQQYLRYPTDEQGVVAECVRGLPELRDMAELHVRALPFANRSVTSSSPRCASSTSVDPLHFSFTIVATRAKRCEVCDKEHVSIHPDLVKMWRSPLPPRPRRAA